MYKLETLVRLKDAKIQVEQCAGAGRGPRRGSAGRGGTCPRAWTGSTLLCGAGRCRHRRVLPVQKPALRPNGASLLLAQALLQKMAEKTVHGGEVTGDAGSISAVRPVAKQQA